jgi:5'-3' exonuclease
MLLDSPALWYRAFYGVPDSVRSPQGEPVNAVRAFRVAAVPSYKLHRTVEGGAEDEPAALTAQVAVIYEVLDALGIPVAGLDGYEADDVIGTLATRETGAVDIVTGDRDLLQLVRDAGPVRVLYAVEKMKPYDEAAVAAKHGIPGRAYAEFAVLRGDPSDGLPGVKGVGEKTAAALVSRFGSVEAIVAALDGGSEDGFPAGARAKLEAARDYLAVAPAVSRVVCDLPLPAYDDALPRSPRDPAALVALSDRWGLDSALERFLQALETAHSG